MAESAQKKSGFRALFGKKSSDKQAPRKKLSKKGSLNVKDTIGGEVVASSQRQDSGSFTSGSLDLTNEESNISSYQQNLSLSPHRYRDSPYAAINPNSSYASQSGSYLAEYRRASDGQQQSAAPLYSTQGARSQSIPLSYDNFVQGERQQGPSPKAGPAKLTKANRTRAPKPDDILDKDTGERKDLTDMMHAFTYSESLDTIQEKHHEVAVYYDPTKPDRTAMLGSASPEIWLNIADLLTPLDVANLASTCRTMYARLGMHPYKLLLDPVNRSHRLDFLLAMDHKLPRHLFCFPCAQWHLRIQPGLEQLKPHLVLNPLFECPNQTNIHLPPPRIRISEGRTLPFAFIQLARRSWEFGPDFGISHQSLSKRWKDPYSDWSHDSMYHVTDNGHVLLRVRSQVYVEGGMTTAAKRMRLFSRGDYTPYFSVCSHWKNGILTSIPKCALDHIPYTPPSEIYAVKQLKDRVVGTKASGITNLCSKCRPMRRCPDCPTEYLFELKLVEDRTVKGQSPERFKQALVVTRWSDLGPGRSPDDKEWAAITGAKEDYDSFLEIGRRAISGVFESAFTDTIPGQRIMSSNPKKVKADEMGGDWY